MLTSYFFWFLPLTFSSASLGLFFHSIFLPSEISKKRVIQSYFLSLTNVQRRREVLNSFIAMSKPLAISSLSWDGAGGLLDQG